MCGIFASLTDSNLDKKSCYSNLLSLQSLLHRGPDHSSTFTFQRLFLGHTRLEIVDHNPLSHQPFTSSCKRFKIVFNGEIYNYKHLKKDYLSGISLKTSSDTEVITELWSILGSNCLSLLDGMFAIVVYDQFLKRVTVARDMFGIKPLYYMHKDSTLYVSSEIPPILSQIELIRPNLQVISNYLGLGLYDHTSNTFFQDIYSYQPGSVTTYSLDDSQIVSSYKYFDPECLTPNTSTSFNPTDATHQLLYLLTDCVESASTADVPIAVNLSGGVDSSLLFKLLSSEKQYLPAYNMSFPDTADSELILESNLQYKYNIIPVAPIDILEHLKDTVRAQCQPFGGLCVVAYSLLYARAAQDRIKVTLDANGLDEIFYGYNKYQLISQGSSTNIHQDGTSFVLPGLLHPSMPAPEDMTIDYFNTQQLSPVRRASIKDLFYHKVPRALRFNDHASMAYSIELRVPFLRKCLLDFSLSLPDNYLLSSSIGKVPIRTILSNLTGNYQHAFKSKASIQSPQTKWLKGPLRSLVDTTLFKTNFLERQWVNPLIATDAINSDYATLQNNSFFIWQMINLELFAQSFFD